MVGERYKCFSCYTIFKQIELIDGSCPMCKEYKYLKVVCEYDPGMCKCLSDHHDSIRICPKCHEPMCPECFSHDVVGISRVTGYLSDVGGWRKSKLAELEDRQRYDLV